MKQVVYSALLLLVCFVCGCDKIQKGIREAAVFVLAAPDYNESKMWYVERNDQGDGVDVFYIPSTWEFDWKTSDSLISHYADPSLPEHRVHMETEMAKVAEYMALGNNFYSPHYRHITLIRGRHSMKIPLRADIWMCLQRCKSCFPPFPHKL